MRVFPGTVTDGGATLADLARALTPLVDRIVQDGSGLSGSFAFTLRWTPEQISPGLDTKARAIGLPPIDKDGPAIFTAVRQQLGLKLDAQRGPVDVVVVDRADRPMPD
jgi:bla regulator protein blaR1